MSSTATASSDSPAVQNLAWIDSPSKPIEEYNTYLCVLPDFEDSKRLQVRSHHLEHSKVGFNNGWIVNAGAMFQDEAGSKMIGSWFLLKETSKQAAFDRLNKDIYVSGGAWDMSKATITAVAISKH